MKIHHFTLPLMLGSFLALSACDKNKEAQTPVKEHAQKQQDVTQSLQTPPVKEFPATADDAQDIALLDEFDERFTSMSDDMENELEKMRQEHSLTPDFERSRKLDHIQSALGMLKELELKTAQGRYIQGLLYHYWEEQGKLLNQQTSSAHTDTQKKPPVQVEGLADYLHAQEQLKHWKGQQKVS